MKVGRSANATLAAPAPLRTPAHRDDLMGMAAPTRWTAAMVRALPDDGNRYEVIDGELLVTPAPTELHQRAVVTLVRLLADYADAQRFGEALASPAALELDPEGRG